MFESRREKILLTMAVVLLTMLVADSLIVTPLGRWQDSIDTEAKRLRTQISQVVSPAAGEHKIQLDSSSIRLSSEQGQNLFRQYLESQAGINVIKSSTKKTKTALAGQDGLSEITYELKLEGSAETLRAFLDNLDSSDEFVRINSLQIAALTQEDQAINMKLVVSTLARESKGVQDDLAEAKRLTRFPMRQPLLPLRKNIFFPGGGKTGRASMPNEFLLIGTTTESKDPAACIEFVGNKESVWVKVGDSVGYATIKQINSSGMEMELPGGEVKHLPISKSSATLWQDSAAYFDNFELVGISEMGGKLFALVRPSGEERVFRLTVYDRLGQGRIVKIEKDHIIVRTSENRQKIAIGGWYISDLQ